MTIPLRKLHEKEFIRNTIGKYSTTAKADAFDDCIVIDLAERCEVPGLPCLVYSLDHPSFIRRGRGEQEDHCFYGNWAAAVVCGDVLAMGAQPRGFSMDLAAPLDLSVERVEWILEGVRQVLDVYGAEFEGGNLDSNALEIVGFSWGMVAKERIIRRGGAQPGDYVVATGILGYGWADWCLRQLDLMNSVSPDAQNAFRQYKSPPLAPISSMAAAFEIGGITSGMDLSDGLIEFLYTIRERSGLGVRLREEWIPSTGEMGEASRLLGVRPALLALEAGFDTPLVHGWTVNPQKWPAIERAFLERGQKIFRLGETTAENEICLSTSSGLRAIPPFWDDQFRQENRIERWREAVREL
jgi:thiamine-monophosphate kinase